MKLYIQEYVLSFVIAAVILAIAIVVYNQAKDLMQFLGWPLENLLASKETQRELMVFLFGRMTPNYASIQLVLYFLFWPTVIFTTIRLCKYAKNT